MRHLFAAFACLLGALVFTTSANATYTANYIFGDSLSDTGNFNALTGGALQPPYWNGRFSNGPVYSEIVANSLGLAADPFFASGGTNYAVGGARTDGHTIAALAPIASLQGQLGAFFNGNGGVADSNALYTLYIGSNDVFDAIDIAAATNDFNSGLAVIANAASIVGQSLDSLAAAGAKTILVPTVTNLGLTPLVPNLAKPLASALASSFNSLVDTFIQSVLASSSDVRIVRPDLFGLLTDAVNNPASYGFTNVTTPCYDGYLTTPGTTVCSNPDETLFWDPIHPTTAGHRLIADATLIALPEPQAVLLVGVGLILMFVARRRRG